MSKDENRKNKIFIMVNIVDMFFCCVTKYSVFANGDCVDENETGMELGQIKKALI